MRGLFVTMTAGWHLGVLNEEIKVVFRYEEDGDGENRGGVAPR